MGGAWRSAKILQRVRGVMYNRPISYQNALLSFGSNITLRGVGRCFVMGGTSNKPSPWQI